MVKGKPTWLPSMVNVNGEWNRVVAMLYGIFDRDFRQSACFLEHTRVLWDQTKLDASPYEEGFWHLITQRDQAMGERLFDPERAKRLPWCRPTLENCRDPEVAVWDYQESSGKVRTYVWLERWDYVIILEKRPRWTNPSAAFLVTAFHVGGSGTKRKLRRKQQARTSIP